VSRLIRIGKKTVGEGRPVFIIAELSANHHQDFGEAGALVRAAHEAGADAVKLQTYTPDTITIQSNAKYFRIGNGTVWEGKNLFDLYTEAYTPWEWQPELKKIANGLGMELFSSPFDPTSVRFLEEMKVPAYKIASFELVDIPLIRTVARCNKPVIISTGMATLEEIGEAVGAVRDEGNDQVALLKCTSAYPASPKEMNLRTIPDLSARFDLPVGLSDHTLGITVPIASVALGSCIIEKHLTLSRSKPGPDSSFSLEPGEFQAMVSAVREAEMALGTVSYGVTEQEMASRIFRRSLFAVKDVKKGEVFTQENIRSIRPGHGLAPKYLNEVIGKRAKRAIRRGSPLAWELIE
jgi:N-acetylneuraminate synthase